MTSRSCLLFLLFAGVTGFGVFVLPWYIPHAHPVNSISYTYGFNNFAAYIWIALMLVVSTGWKLRHGERSLDPGGFQQALSNILPTDVPYRRDNWLFGLYLAITIFALGVIGVMFWWLPKAYFGETIYFLSHLDVMVMGQRPYRDFHFDYGPLMAYLPYFLYSLPPCRLSIEQAYGIALLLHWSAGIYLLYYIVSRLNGRLPRLVFLISVFFASFNLTLGLQYTPLRYTLPLASLIALHRFVAKHCDVCGGRWKIAIFALVMPLMNFALSPEMGVATWLATFVYFLFFWNSPQRRLMWFLPVVVAALPLTVGLFSSSYFAAILSFSGGGNSFPIYPTLAIVFYLVAVFSVVPNLTAISLGKDGAQSSLSAAFCVVMGLLILAVLGRCDAGHVTLNGLGVLIFFTAALFQVRPGSKRIHAAVAGYFVVFVVVNQFSFWTHYQPQIKMLLSLQGQLDARPQNSWQREFSSKGLRYNKLLPTPAEYGELPGATSIGTPLGCDEVMERYLKLTGRFVPEYHMGPYFEIYQQPHLDRKLQDMRKMELIVFPASSRGFLDEDSPAGSKALAKLLSDLLMFPVNLEQRNNRFFPQREIMLEIQRNYSEIDAVGGYILAKRKVEADK